MASDRIDPVIISDPHAFNGLGHLIVLCTLPTLATIAVALRVYTRLRIVKVFCIEDYTTVAALILSFGVGIGQAVELHFGSGRHTADVSPANTVKVLKAFYSTLPFYFITLVLVKISIILLYLRICKNDRIPRIACYIMIAVSLIATCIILPMHLLICNPVHEFWDFNLIGPNCMPREKLWMATSISSVIGDFILLFFPFVILRHLTLPTAQRWTVIGILSFGGLACIASLLHLHSIYAIDHDKDILWYHPTGALWACIEAHLGIICASVTTLRPLASKLFPSLTFLSVEPGLYNSRTLAIIDIPVLRELSTTSSDAASATTQEKNASRSNRSSWMLELVKRPITSRQDSSFGPPSNI